jgi:ribonuclease P protein component
MLCDSRAMDRVFREGKYTLKGDLAMHFIPNGLAESRFALIISGKVGKAHERNAIRRKMREILRSLLPTVRPGNDIAFVVRKGAEGVYAGLRDDIGWLLSSRGLLIRGGA